jgi:hypothetical protein
MLVLLLCSAPVIALAQAPAAKQTTPTEQAPATTSSEPQMSQPDKPLLRPQELDQLVAPIALYPDPLLSNVLMASTYPLEVVQADRWLKENKNLQGDQLSNAASQQPWDNSLKALFATPSVLDMMSTKLDWTQRLGDAVLAQQADVMDAVQRLRERAQANNKLTTTAQQKVTVRQEQNRQIIAIEPATPDAIYVPYYDPAVVYGDWPYPDYPPYYWGYPDYIAPGIIATGLAFGAAYGIARWAGYWRGGGFAWGNRGIIAGGGARVEHWRHNAMHRGGVGYTNANVRQQFGAANARAGNAARQNLQAGAANRAAAGNRAGAVGNRAAAGNRAGTAGNRTGGKQQAKTRGAGGKQAQARKGGGKQAQARKSGARQQAGRSGGRSAASRQARGGRSAGASRQARPAAHARGGGIGGGHAFRGGGGRSFARGGGGGGLRAGGFGGGRGGFGGGRGGGGRRSDVALKRDVALLGYLDNGLGFYRFRYLDDDRAYVGVIAQQVQRIRPEAVNRGPDGYLRVRYDRLGLKFQTYNQWISSGARVPATSD